MNNNTKGDFDFEWLRFPLPIHDPEGLRRLLSLRLGSGQFYLEWDGRMLSALYWQKKTRSRMAALKRDFNASRNRFDSFADAESGHFGTSFAEALSEAADYFGISYSTLHRLIRPPLGKQRKARMSAATYYKIRKARHYPDSSTFREELDRVVLGPKVGRITREYLSYIERELLRFGTHRSAKHDVVPQKYKNNPRTDVRQEWRARHGFHQSAARLGAPATRARLADLRVYDAVVAWHRMRRKLTPLAQSRIVRAGYRREMQILRLEMRVLHDAIETVA